MRTRIVTNVLLSAEPSRSKTCPRSQLARSVYSTSFDLIRTLTWLSLSFSKVKKPSAITSLSSTFFVIIFSGFILPELIAWRTSSKSPRTYVATPYPQVSQLVSDSLETLTLYVFSRKTNWLGTILASFSLRND